MMRNTRKGSRSRRSDTLGIAAHIELLAGIAGETVHLGLPAEPAGQPGLHLQPLELREAGPARAAGWQPVDALAAHLVTATGKDALQTLSILSEAALAAHEDRRVLCDLIPPPATLWQALGVVPRPSWTLLVPLVKPRAAIHGPPVTTPLSLGFSNLVPIVGQVVTAGGRPLAGIRLSAPGLAAPARTDAAGRFRIHVPADARPTHLTAALRSGATSLPLSPGDQPQILVIPSPPET